MSDFDFIQRMDDYLNEHYPLNHTWSQLLSAATLASVLTKDTNFVTDRGPNACNLWIGYFAPSGDYKSTPIDNVTIPLLEAISRVQKRYVILPSIASTVEGLVKYFKKNEKNRNGVILRDELTTLFKEVSGKTYMTDEMEIYSKMYDGKIMPRETMRFESRKIIYIYVNLIGATTPRYLYETLPVNFYYQGCGNRFLYVKHKLPPQINDTKDTLFNKTQKWISDGLPGELKEFFEFLNTVSDAPYEILMSDDNALETSTKFHNDREYLKSQIKENSDDAFKREYLSRDWQKSLKLAQLHAISRKGLGPTSKKVQPDGRRLIEIDPEDIEWGQKIVLECYNYFGQIVAEWKTHVPSQQKPIFKKSHLLYMYLGYIKEYGVISQKKLAHEVGNPSRNKEFMNILGFLVGSGYVKQETDTAEFVRQKGMTWMEKMMINPKFRHPPVLYSFVKDLPRQ
jgi:hypothetical protein